MKRLADRLIYLAFAILVVALVIEAAVASLKPLLPLLVGLAALVVIGRFIVARLRHW